MAKHRWPLRSRDVTGHVDGSVWNGVNASSWHVYNASGHRLKSMLLGYVTLVVIAAVQALVYVWLVWYDGGLLSVAYCLPQGIACNEQFSEVVVLVVD